jgi:hypothetical protein
VSTFLGSLSTSVYRLFYKAGGCREAEEKMVGWQLGLTIVPLPLILYVAYTAIGWLDFIKKRVEDELEWIMERGCAACPLSKVCLPLYQVLYSLAYIVISLVVYGIPSIFFGSLGAFIGATVVILINLPTCIKFARTGRFLLALLMLMYQVFGALAMALLWLYNPIVFALVVAADYTLQALAAWWLVGSRVQRP